MAKKSLIERNKKRQRLVEKYFHLRQSLKKEMNQTLSVEEKWIFYKKLQALPRNSAGTRIKNICFITGRSKAYYRDFGISRHTFREMAHACLLPGLTKSSW
jgi:small subunit ribosomal protein S14|uniref:Small ribosomal subunit protein uS14c n=1 Tax=Chara vulgaris TaxID=55564 RepID=RR14_CHAVU|nr:ribosomal protein S14 [Chara vulgaris]Q1ACL2.1 RecName: Full=Small ribosomal subunit protein uS14c; AltName: Full=30S ribosomal protein S14, chloroplastic [Chara vulgaris]ABA61974.1 ribosomal protein S14 [Chara vulgaris]WAP91309.1 ribosomal protein S14 [Chara vulgaris]